MYLNRCHTITEWLLVATLLAAYLIAGCERPVTETARLLEQSEIKEALVIKLKAIVAVFNF